MEYYSQSVTPARIGYLYMQIEKTIREYLDVLIRSNTHKLYTIKFLCALLGFGLTETQALYEAREVWLNRTPNAYGW